MKFEMQCKSNTEVIQLPFYLCRREFEEFSNQLHNKIRVQFDERIGGENRFFKLAIQLFPSLLQIAQRVFVRPSQSSRLERFEKQYLLHINQILVYFSIR